MRANWTEEETELFKKVYPVKTSAQLEEMFPKYTRQQMLTKATGLGIKKRKEVANESRRNNFRNSEVVSETIWTEQEKKLLLEVYPQKGFEGAREAFKETRTDKAIVRMVRRLKLTRSNNSLIWERQSSSITNENGIPTIEITYKGW